MSYTFLRNVRKMFQKEAIFNFLTTFFHCIIVNSYDWIKLIESILGSKYESLGSLGSRLGVRSRPPRWSRVTVGFTRLKVDFKVDFLTKFEWKLGTRLWPRLQKSTFSKPVLWSPIWCLGFSRDPKKGLKHLNISILYITCD
jgi:hypothetical protein